MDNLSRISRQLFPPRNEGKLCSKGPSCQAKGSLPRMLPLRATTDTLHSAVSTTRTMNSCSLKFSCLFVSIFRFKVLDSDLWLMWLPMVKRMEYLNYLSFCSMRKGSILTRMCALRHEIKNKDNSGIGQSEKQHRYLVQLGNLCSF